MPFELRQRREIYLEPNYNSKIEDELVQVNPTP